MIDEQKREFNIRQWMVALQAEDRLLLDIKRQLNVAQAEFEVASRRYAAVRDLVTENLGQNPYSVEASGYNVTLPTEGAFRYLLMNPGDAAVQVLQDSKSYMTLGDITDALREGGLDTIDSRIVNAALMRQTGIKKSANGRFKYEPKEG